jgi:hypothetical protein
VALFNENEREIRPKGLFRTTCKDAGGRATQEQLPSRFSILGQAPRLPALKWGIAYVSSKTSAKARIMRHFVAR